MIASTFVQSTEGNKGKTPAEPHIGHMPILEQERLVNNVNNKKQMAENQRYSNIWKAAPSFAIPTDFDSPLAVSQSLRSTSLAR